jgi:ABC-2 type transport system permease protein
MRDARVSRLRSFVASFRMAVLTFVADPQWIVPSSIAPVVFGLVAFELYRRAGPGLVVYAVLGAGMMSMWGQTLYGSGWAIDQDRSLGTLEPTLASPTPYLYVVLARVAWNAVSGLIGGGIVFVVVEAAYGRPLPLANPIEFALLFVLVIATLATVGIVLTSAFVYTRYAGFVQNFGEFAFYIGTGCMFPIVLLPFWTNPIALVLPPTWALDALRYMGIPGYRGLPWGFWGDLAGALAVATVYLSVAASLFRRVERHVRERGTLGYY